MRLIGTAQKEIQRGEYRDGVFVKTRTTTHTVTATIKFLPESLQQRWGQQVLLECDEIFHHVFKSVKQAKSFLTRQTGLKWSWGKQKESKEGGA